MSLFDWYRPEPGLACPQCGDALTEWQGKDGPCQQLIWRQGSASPEASEYTPRGWQPLGAHLPASFGIYSVDCDCEGLVEALGTCEAGVWTQTRVEE